MKTRVTVKKVKNEWVFIVKDYDGNVVEEFRCKAPTKKEAEVYFNTRNAVKERAS